MDTKIKWFAYLHANGSVHVKRFFDSQGIAEVRESEFVTIVFGPFAAATRDGALEIAYNRFKYNGKPS